jgi:hypothetical protein
MIKQTIFQDELILGMQQELHKQASATPDLVKASECLHGAMDILESINLDIHANKVFALMLKIAQKADPHTKGLTSAKQIANLKNHGTQFNLAQDMVVPSMKEHLSKDDMDPDFADLLDSPSFDLGASDDDLMGLDVKEDDLEVFDKQLPLSDFEEEKD